MAGRSVLVALLATNPAAATELDLAIRFARPASMRVDLRRFGLSVYSEGSGNKGPWEQNLLQWSRGRPARPAVKRSATEWKASRGPRTFRIARMEQDYGLHPDMHGAASAIQAIESSWRDYRTVEGLVLPMPLLNRDRRSGEVVQTITVRDVRLNLPLDARIFEGR